MWNFSRRLAGINPHDNLMQGHCGKILNRQCLNEKVKVAAQLLKRVHLNKPCNQLQDSNTFRNWWQFYANGEKPVSFVELQRRKVANRGFVDRLKNPNAAKFVKIFTTTEPQDEHNVYDQMYKEFVSCFECPKPKQHQTSSRQTKLTTDRQGRKTMWNRPLQSNRKKEPGALQKNKVPYNMELTPSKSSLKTGKVQPKNMPVQFVDEKEGDIKDEGHEENAEEKNTLTVRKSAKAHRHIPQRTHSLPILKYVKLKKLDPIRSSRERSNFSFTSISSIDLTNPPDYWRDLRQRRQDQMKNYELSQPMRSSTVRLPRIPSSILSAITKGDTPKKTSLLAAAESRSMRNVHICDHMVVSQRKANKSPHQDALSTAGSMEEVKAPTRGLSVAKPNDADLKTLQKYTSSMFWKLTPGDSDHLTDISMHKFNPIDIEQHINHFMSKNQLSFDMFSSTPRNWPCRFESMFVRHMRNLRLKNLLLSKNLRKRRKRLKQKPKSLTKKPKERKESSRAKPELTKVNSCEICRKLSKIEPDPPYMIEMKRRHAREELRTYYRQRLSTDSNSQASHLNWTPKQTQSLQPTTIPCSIDNIPKQTQSLPQPLTHLSCPSPILITKQRLDQSMQQKLMNCFKILCDCQTILDKKFHQLKLDERRSL